MSCAFAGLVRAASLGLVVALTVAVLLASPAHGQGQTFAVEGSLINGTAGGEVPVGARVQAYAYTRDRIDGPWETQSDDLGRYRIEGVPVAEGAVYVIGVDYAGASYAERFDPPAADHVLQRDLGVYETSLTDPGIRFEQVAILFGTVDGVAVNVVEIHRVENPTDRTFAPSASGPGGSAGLLVFPLPAGAFELRPEVGLDPARVIQIDRGFASLTPLPPGRSEIGFSYRFPYTDSTFELARTIRYPVSRMTVLYAEDGPRIESDRLGPGDAASVGGRSYRTLAGGPLQAGEALRLTLTGLPLPGGPLGRVPPAAAAVVGSLIGLGVLTYAAVRSRRGSEPGPDTVDHVLDEVVRLEQARAELRIPEDEYRRVRGELLDQLRPRIGTGNVTGA